MGLWKSLLVALGLAKKKVRVETGAGTRSPRPRRRRPSLARSSVPDEKRAPDAFPCRLLLSIIIIMIIVPTATDRTRRPEKKTLSSPQTERSVVCSS
jgi:hypothetical protein